MASQDNSAGGGKKKKYVYTCETEGCEKRRHKEGICYKCFKKKHGSSPRENENKPGKKKTKKRSMKEKIPGNGSTDMPELQALIRKTGKEQLRGELMPMIEEMRGMLDNIEGFFNMVDAEG